MLADDDLGVCPIAVEVHHEAPLLDAGHLAHEAPEALELHLTTAQTIEFTLFKNSGKSLRHTSTLWPMRARAELIFRGFDSVPVVGGLTEDALAGGLIAGDAVGRAFGSAMLERRDRLPPDSSLTDASGRVSAASGTPFSCGPPPAYLTT